MGRKQPEDFPDKEIRQRDSLRYQFLHRKMVEYLRQFEHNLTVHDLAMDIIYYLAESMKLIPLPISYFTHGSPMPAVISQYWVYKYPPRYDAEKPPTAILFNKMTAVIEKRLALYGGDYTNKLHDMAHDILKIALTDFRLTSTNETISLLKREE